MQIHCRVWCFVFYQVAENLAQLMYSVMMTGYMFKNAQYRLELQQSLEQVALPDAQEKKQVRFLFLEKYKSDCNMPSSPSYLP